MKITKLEAENFGSIKHKAVIDFEAIGNDIFLFSGGTGVGKTTILDAISFALFGKCSGQERASLAGVDLISDYALSYNPTKKTTKKGTLKVNLQFSHKGKLYEVFRSTSGSGENRSVLLEDGIQIKESSYAHAKKRTDFSNEVTTEIEKLLTFNAKQYNQIAILAQGEFEEFMKAAPKEKEEMLGRLVMNDFHKDLQNRLAAGRASAKTKIAKLETDLQNQTELLEHCQTLTLEEKAPLKPEATDLQEKLHSLEQAKAAELKQLEQDYATLDQEKSVLNARKGAGESFNRQLQQEQKGLKEAEEKLTTLNKQADVIKSKNSSLQSLGALTRVLPSYQAEAEAQQRVGANARDIDAYKEALRKLHEELPRLQAQQAEEEKHTPEATQKGEKIASLKNNILPVYDKLKTAAEAVVKAENAQTKAKKDAETKKLALEGQKAEKKTLELELENYKAVNQEQVTLAEKALEQLRDKARKLVALKKKVEKATQDEKKLEQEKDKAVNLANRAKQLRGAWIDLGQRFYNGQAASLAAEMRRKLEEKDEQGNPLVQTVNCPVCGVAHTLAELNSFQPQGEIIAKEELDKAEENYQKAEKQRSTQAEVVTQKQTETEGSQAQIEQELQELIGQYSYAEVKTLAPNSPIIQTLETITVEGTAGREALTALKLRLQEKLTKEQKLKELEQTLPTYETNWQIAETAVSEANTKLATARAEKQALEDQLQGYPATKAEAQQKIDLLGREKKAIEDAIKAAGEAVTKCSGELKSKTALLEAAEKQKAQLQREAQNKQTEFLEALGKAQLKDEAQLRALVTHFGFQLTDSKLLEQVTGLQESYRTDIDSYHREESGCLKSIEHFKTALKDKVEVDITALKEQIQELEAKQQEITARKDQYINDVSLLRNVLGKVKELLVAKAKCVKILEVLEPLGDAAKNKLTFTRFMLGKVFQAILDQANRRLKKISSNEFELVIVDEHNNGGKTPEGLDFLARSLTTGKERKASELSGGEKFEVSLSLALGLSDIMQSISKQGSRIETIFIDEGFGTLGEENLQRTIEVLLEIAGTDRQIGIISHNPVLEDAIDKKVIVTRNKYDMEGTKITTNF